MEPDEWTLDLLAAEQQLVNLHYRVIEKYVDSVNNILLPRLGFNERIETIDDCTPNMFIAILEAMLSTTIEGIDRNPESIDSHAENMRVVIDFLGSEVIGAELEHIDPTLLCRGDLNTISNLLDIFLHLCDILHGESSNEGEKSNAADESSPAELPDTSAGVGTDDEEEPSLGYHSAQRAARRELKRLPLDVWQSIKWQERRGGRRERTRAATAAGAAPRVALEPRDNNWVPRRRTVTAPWPGHMRPTVSRLFGAVTPDKLKHGFAPHGAAAPPPTAARRAARPTSGARPASAGRAPPPSFAAPSDPYTAANNGAAAAVRPQSHGGWPGGGGGGGGGGGSGGGGGGAGEVFRASLAEEVAAAHERAVNPATPGAEARRARAGAALARHAARRLGVEFAQQRQGLEGDYRASLQAGHPRVLPRPLPS
jgi:hypothetical protein